MPPLKFLKTVSEYRSHFERIYCAGTIPTFDGILVRFRKHQFDHCFFESSKRDQKKDTFSRKRAERIDWIKAALQDAQADLFEGWDSKTKSSAYNRRVCIVSGNYVVVIEIIDGKKAEFITAFVADTTSSLQKIRSSKKWIQS